MNASNTVFDVKRLIGRKYSDSSVRDDMKHWPFNVKSGPNGTPIIEVHFKGECKSFKAEEISAMVLTKMKGNHILSRLKALSSSLKLIDVIFRNS